MNINAYKYGDKVIDLEKVPALSEPTVKFLRRLENIDKVKTGNLSHVPVGIVAQSLKKYTDDLDYIKKHPISNVVSAITRSVLTAAIVGAGVLGVLYTSIPVICGIGAGLIYFIAAGENSSREYIDIKFNILDIGLLAVGGPIFPIFGIFAKKQRLEGLVNNSKNDLNILLNQREILFKADFSKTLKVLEDDVNLPGRGEEATSIANTALNEIKANIAYFSPKAA